MQAADCASEILRFSAREEIELGGQYDFVASFSINEFRGNRKASSSFPPFRGRMFQIGRASWSWNICASSRQRHMHMRPIAALRMSMC